MLVLCILVCCAGCSATASAANSNGAGTESESADGTPPEKPDGKAPNGAPPDKPGGGPGGEPGGFGGSGEVTQGTSANTITEDGTYSGKTYTSTGDDENALRIDGAEAELKNISVDKSAGASSNPEDGDFYGMNAAVLATNGAQVTISGAKISSDAQNGNGVFSYGEGTVVTVSDTVISTAADNSGGIQTTGGGTTNAENLTVSTKGNSSAAIRSDRGGGTVSVNGGSYTTAGYNSPAVYSTADITVKDASLTAENSEALVIEGKNSITLENCTVSGSMSKTEGSSSDENVHNVMLYQSMSGDADVGTSEYDMIGGSLTCNAGPVLYNTNTSSYITFQDVDVSYSDETTYWLQVTGNSSSRTWGKAGNNGANCIFTGSSQEMKGDVVYDTISNLDFYVLNGSELDGAIVCNDELNGGYSGDGVANVYVDKDSVWNVTADSVITGTLYLEGKIEGAKVVGTDGTVYVDGKGFTVTVGAFSDKVDASNAGEIPVWDDYAVENPFAASGEPSGEASGEASGEPASKTSGGTTPPERPADLGPSDEPPGGFGGID